ncbi:hypothetical protein J7I83_04135 [Planococcus sp. ISL-110]|nr:hypothetical protein [Planococcus sp. ISL-110]MBT2569783.1 hypothetical protein [Planococcus sp. ISL-110]
MIGGRSKEFTVAHPDLPLNAQKKHRRRSLPCAKNFKDSSEIRSWYLPIRKIGGAKPASAILLVVSAKMALKIAAPTTLDVGPHGNPALSKNLPQNRLDWHRSARVVKHFFRHNMRMAASEQFDDPPPELRPPLFRPRQGQASLTFPFSRQAPGVPEPA